MNIMVALQFWGVAALLAMTPGADWAYAIAAGLRTRRIAPSILGMLAGYTVVVVVVALGVGALVTRYPVSLTVLTLAGAAYLLYLGISTLIARPTQIQASDRSLGENTLAQFFRGAGVSGINPKGLLLLLALLPQFTTPGGWPSAAQMLVLGVFHLINCAVIYSLVALGSRRILSSRPKAALLVTRFSGVAMTLIGLALVCEKVMEYVRI